MVHDIFEHLGQLEQSPELVVLQEQSRCLTLHDDLLLRLFLGLFNFAATDWSLLALQKDVIVLDDQVDLLRLGRPDHLLLVLNCFRLFLGVLLVGCSIAVLVLFFRRDSLLN